MLNFQPLTAKVYESIGRVVGVFSQEVVALGHGTILAISLSVDARI
jgi:hypothetical protein